jgi:hypothetical protein
LANAPAVQDRLRALFVDEVASVLVCSAACGADLLALEAAGGLGMRRRVVLPFERDRFRESSVTDRPGHCGPMFDEIIDGVTAAGDLVVLEDAGEGGDAYAAATDAIVDEAARVAQSESVEAGSPGAVVAVVVWEGRSRGEGDETARFAELARARDFRVVDVLTV